MPDVAKPKGILRVSAISVASLTLLGLAGCAMSYDPFDPFQRPGNWAETGAPLEDIAQQAATPSDLIRGQSEPLSSGTVAAAGLDKALGAEGAGTATGLQTAAMPISTASSN